MAELILTPEEQATALWSDLSDEALGKLVKKKMSIIESASEQLNRTVSFSAALLLCCQAAERKLAYSSYTFEGVTQNHREFGDWRITIVREDLEEADPIYSPI